jgi:hypothetical protein
VGAVRLMVITEKTEHITDDGVVDELRVIPYLILIDLRCDFEVRLTIPYKRALPIAGLVN